MLVGRSGRLCLKHIGIAPADNVSRHKLTPTAPMRIYTKPAICCECVIGGFVTVRHADGIGNVAPIVDGARDAPGACDRYWSWLRSGIFFFAAASNKGADERDDDDTLYRERRGEGGVSFIHGDFEKRCVVKSVTPGEAYALVRGDHAVGVRQRVRAKLRLFLKASG